MCIEELLQLMCETTSLKNTMNNVTVLKKLSQFLSQMYTLIYGDSTE